MPFGESGLVLWCKFLPESLLFGTLLRPASLTTGWRERQRARRPVSIILCLRFAARVILLLFKTDGSISKTLKSPYGRRRVGGRNFFRVSPNGIMGPPPSLPYASRPIGKMLQCFLYRVSPTNRSHAVACDADTSTEKCRVRVASSIGKIAYHFSFRGWVLHANGGETRKFLPLATTELHQKCKCAEKFFSLKPIGFPSCNR